MRRVILAVGLLSGLVSVPHASAGDMITASIVLTKTVGVGANSGCATTNDIVVPIGSSVTYCYQVQNTGPTTLLTHTLVDSEIGTIVGPNAVFPLAPGEVVSRTVTQGPIVQQIVNTATWTAITDEVEYSYTKTIVATSTAMATVTVAENVDQACRDHVDNDGDMLVDCADPDCLNAPTCGAAAPVMGSIGMLLLAAALLVGGTVALGARRRRSA